MQRYKVWRLVAFFIIGSALSLYADYDYDSGNIACCPSRTPPLVCGAWDLQVHGGIMPIHWKGLGEIDSLVCPGLTPGVIVAKALTFPQFDRLYHIPWLVGVQLGYAYSDSLRFYLEYDASQAKSQNPCKTQFPVTSAVAPAGTTLNFVLGKYKLWSFNVGGEYYCSRLADRVAFFFGAKLGFVRHQRTNFGLSIVIVPDELVLIDPSSCTALFNKNVTPTCGINVGFDFLLGEHWNLLINADIMANAGPQSDNKFMVLPSEDSRIVISQTDTEIRFPTSVALRYSF